MIQNPARLTLNKGQLRLENDCGVHTLPLEDVTALILESPQISLTSALLAQCQDHGIAVITCDATHTPNGLMVPFQPHSRQSKVARIQVSWTDDLKKRLWQRLVQAKITGQAHCLSACEGKDAATRLYALSGLVESGDPANTEAQAAREYWPRLMGSDFRRGGNCIVNAALNYGYAIIRANVARAQVSYGLLPAFGIHHDNELNAFNLTDDVMEVFRPLADMEVRRMKDAGELEGNATLSIENRQKLAALGAAHCRIAGQIHTLANAAEKMAAGLVNAIEGRSAALLPVPEWNGGP